MNSINFYSGDKFPMYREALARMQDMIKLVGGLAGMGGKNFILSGCEMDNDGNVSDGVVVVDGEIMPLKGTKISDVERAKIGIKEIRRDVSALNVIYPETYIDREAQFLNNGEYNWSDFEPMKTNVELAKTIQDITGDKPGTVKMWAGLITKIPKDYMLCDGSPLDKDEYPELHSNIEYSFGVDGQNNFKLPDLRGRFIVGYDSGDTSYNEISKKGGNAFKELSEANLPAHDHVYSDDVNAKGKFMIDGQAFPAKYEDIGDEGSSAQKGGTGTLYRTTKTGKGERFDIRPPFFTLAYIIKVR